MTSTTKERFFLCFPFLFLCLVAAAAAAAVSVSFASKLSVCSLLRLQSALADSKACFKRRRISSLRDRSVILFSALSGTSLLQITFHFCRHVFEGLTFSDKETSPRGRCSFLLLLLLRMLLCIDDGGRRREEDVDDLLPLFLRNSAAVGWRGVATSLTLTRFILVVDDDGDDDLFVVLSDDRRCGN